jgi:hypothetical protein
MTATALDRRGTPANRSKQSAGGQSGNVEERDIRPEEPRSGEIPRLPDRIEFFLEGAQALKIVEAVRVSPDQAAEMMPARCQAMLPKPRERRYAKAEATVALVSRPFHQLDEQIFHCIP